MNSEMSIFKMLISAKTTEFTKQITAICMAPIKA
jgi:hypothetical protein